MEKLNVGIIGCGNISEIYLKNCPTFDTLRVTACADLLPKRAKATAKKFGIRALSPEELLADREVDIVLNLTVPKAHTEINLAALAAGKHVYTEKPFATTLADGQATLAAADEAKRLVGSAPDTFLGGGLQTCRKLIDEGAIGEPVGAVAFMASHGMEAWHPDPEFFFKPGGGPILDMGPYYLTALVSILGPICRISGSARISFPERVVTSKPNYGKHIPVETPTHITGTLDFANGAVATLIMSFDVWAHNLPRLEIYGTEGTLSLPDPNTFGGTIRLWQNEKNWVEAANVFGYTQNSRGVGVADLALAAQTGRIPRASGKMALHVLEAMLAFEKASRVGAYETLTSTCERPVPMAAGLGTGEIA